MHWPPGSNHQDTQAPSPNLAATASPSKTGLYELKSASPLSEKKDDDTDSEEDAVPLENKMQKNSFDNISVLISDVHSLIRFSPFHCVPPKTDSKDLASLPLSDYQVQIHQKMNIQAVNKGSWSQVRRFKRN